MSDSGRCPTCGRNLSMRVDGVLGRWCNGCGYDEPLGADEMPVEVPVVRHTPRVQKKSKKEKARKFFKKGEK